MAKIRINIELILDITDAATRDKIKDGLVALKTKFQNINIGLDNEERSSIRYHICRHDEGLSCDEEVIVL